MGIKMTTPEIESIPRPKALFEAIADRLRSRILSHEIPPGAAIDESAVARELGVSRTPVREAIKVLARDGLVTVAHRRSNHCLVTEFSACELGDLLRITEHLEAFHHDWETNPFVQELLQRMTDKIHLALGPSFLMADLDAKQALHRKGADTPPAAHASKKALADYFAWRRLEVAKRVMKTP
ncbi:GntR family transcriptional regulator [Zoogloea sp.]|uniref:GntR family transcriptional regulator n=1 Tax=Zoogloea sp. TaxID=49181 RepID=UPI001AC06FCE|nr:GntR family transcriptional regulator [Zoogloea sp.]MBN8281930.1 GntR family transcriptional regulator [Zoogloea sp.]